MSHILSSIWYKITFIIFITICFYVNGFMKDIKEGGLNEKD